jgi:hypothetical protein
MRAWASAGIAGRPCASSIDLSSLCEEGSSQLAKARGVTRGLGLFSGAAVLESVVLLIRRLVALSLGMAGAYTAVMFMDSATFAAAAAQASETSWAPVWVAVVVAMSGTLSPVLLAYLTNKNRHSERLEDYARQDAVAAQAAEAARLLVERQDAAAGKAAEAARLLLAANERVAKTAAVTNIKLDVIHTLVNSSMTEALQSELRAVTSELRAIERELAMMVEMGELRRASGGEASPTAVAAIEATRERIIELKTKIAELTAKLDDRLKQTAVAADQAAAAVTKT